MAVTIPPASTRLALKLANASMLAYDQLTMPAQFTMPPGYTLAGQFTADVLGHLEPFGFVMKSATDAVLAFRGTADFPDDIADIRFSQASFPYASNSGGMTHIGFTNVYQSCRTAVIAAVAALPADITLYITGHSLGAAVATLAALTWPSIRHSSSRSSTASPARAGNLNFANSFDSVLVTSAIRSCAL